MKCITALKSKPRSLVVSRHYMPGLWLCYSAVLIALLSQMLTDCQTHSKYLHEVKSYIQTLKHTVSFYFYDSFSEVGIFFLTKSTQYTSLHILFSKLDFILKNNSQQEEEIRWIISNRSCLVNHNDHYYIYNDVTLTVKGS